MNKERDLVAVGCSSAAMILLYGIMSLVIFN